MTVGAAALSLTIPRSSLAYHGLSLSEPRTGLKAAFPLNLGCLPGQETHSPHAHMDHPPHQNQE